MQESNNILDRYVNILWESEKVSQLIFDETWEGGEVVSLSPLPVLVYSQPFTYSKDDAIMEARAREAQETLERAQREEHERRERVRQSKEREAADRAQKEAERAHPSTGTSSSVSSSGVRGVRGVRGLRTTARGRGGGSAPSTRG